MNQMNRQHGLWLTLALALGPAVSNGFARFAYGLILPAMSSDLGWSYTQAGWLYTVNTMGYLAGALLTLWGSNRIGAARLFRYGMVLAALSLLSCIFTRNLGWLIVWRSLAGVAAAPIFICSGILANAIYPQQPQQAANASSLCFGGAGLGILISALVLPVLFERQGVSAWPAAWLFLAVSSLIFVVPAIWASRHVVVPTGNRVRTSWPIWRCLPSLAGYGFFGAGYIVYMTFVVAWARSQGSGMGVIISLWGTLGISIMLSPFLWRPVLAKYRPATTLGLSIGIMACGAGLAWLMPNTVGLLMSAALFGMGFFTAPAAVIAFARDNLPDAARSSAFASYTIMFAVTQSITPVVAGALIDQTGSMRHALLLSMVLLAVGTALACLQADLSPADVDPAVIDPA